jgi:hypothetical protein
MSLSAASSVDQAPRNQCSVARRLASRTAWRAHTDPAADAGESYALGSNRAPVAGPQVFAVRQRRWMLWLTRILSLPIRLVALRTWITLSWSAYSGMENTAP